MHCLGLVVGALVLGVVTTGAATYKLNCAPRDRVVRHLAKTYAEKVIAIGLSDRGAVIELILSDDRKSWTIITTTPDGNSCQIAEGKYWEFLPRGAPYKLSQ